MKRLRVAGERPLRGTLRLPGDLHIGQQALLWAALSRGTCHISGLGARADHTRLISALRDLGVPISQTDQRVRIEGVGLRGLRAPSGALQAGDSVTTLEILSALLCGQSFGTRVEASGRAAERSLRALVEPLRARGASLAGKRAESGEVYAPIAVAPLLPGERLSEVEIEIPEGDSTTKLALLLSGLYARGVTAVSEGVLSPDHVERALVALGVSLETMASIAVLETSAAEPGWGGFDWHVPADFSLAAYVLAAASVIAGSDVTLPGVAMNRTRSAFLDVLRHAGANVEVTPKGDAAGNEPIADLRVRHATLRSVRVSGELSLRLFNELPALALLNLGAAERSTLRDASGVRLQKPDRLRALAHCLRAFGCDCTEYENGFDLEPRVRPQATRMTAGALHGAEVFFAFLALVARGESSLENAGQLETDFPGMVPALRSLGAAIEVEESS